MGSWSGTSRRLVVGFAILLSLVVSASLFAVVGVNEMHHDLHQVGVHERSSRHLVELQRVVERAAAAHLARDEHGRRESARRNTWRLLAEIRSGLEGSEARSLLPSLTQELKNLEALLNRPREVVSTRSGRRAINRQVAIVVESSRRLASSMERDLGKFEGHASIVSHTAIRWTMIFLLLCFLFATAFGVYLGRSVALPVAKLEQGAVRLARGDLETRIALDRNDEFGRLARQFNDMTVSLKEHQVRLIRSERLAGIGQLAAGVAHEINNPIGVILGYVRLLRKKLDGEDQEDLAVIEDEAVRCQEIVEGLLDLARPPTFPPEPVNLREICEEVLERLGESPDVPRPSASVQGNVTVVGQAPRLRQVVLNLVRNAFEAAGTEGRVSIDIRTVASERVEMRVSDTGPGIPDAHRASLFDPFFTTKAGGTGLGLAVSQAIAEAHGGRIEAAGGAGSGAAFTLILPLPSADPVSS